MIGRVYLLPDNLPREEITGSTAIVIDVLRATTTICQALAAGAQAVWPCETVEEAIARAGTIGRDICLLGGERGGVRIEGFDLGNSPLEYAPERVAGKEIVFTTTNGTRAMAAARAAKQILLGAIVNRAALCQRISRDERVAIICAGTDGRPSQDDILAAGAIVAALHMWNQNWNEDALKAANAWRAVESHKEGILQSLRDSLGGANLLSLGYDSDIHFAARVDTLSVVPSIEGEGPMRIDGHAARGKTTFSDPSRPLPKK